jgi:hypothetical protein
VTRAKISEYSATANDNTDVNGVNIAENCPPSSMNNMGREIMAALKRFQTGSDGDGVTVGGSLVVSGSTTVNTFNVDVISEKTSAAGVTIDGVLLKDNGVVTGAGTVSAPAIVPTGDTNTGIFFPAADTIAFAEGGAEAMRIDSAGRVGIGLTAPTAKFHVQGGTGIATFENILTAGTGADTVNVTIKSANRNAFLTLTSKSTDSSAVYFGDTDNTQIGSVLYSNTDNSMQFIANNAERMRIDSSGNVGIGTSSPAVKLQVLESDGVVGFSVRDNLQQLNIATDLISVSRSSGSNGGLTIQTASQTWGASGGWVRFNTNGSERMRIDTSGNLLVGKTSTATGAGCELRNNGVSVFTASGAAPSFMNRLTNDGNLIEFAQDNTVEGTISVSGNTVSYNAFCGGHWTQLQEGRGYNPDIHRGTVMSSIGEMAVWKSVEWTETVEHPAVEAVEAVEAVLDEDGNVIEPAVEAVEGKEAWTETFNKRENYFGTLDIGATFEEDGFTKTVVDDGNERLPKVKISDVVGDKAVYGVFQTWDEVEDMLISSLGAFVVRVASGVTVEIGDLLESNGDGCAKVQDDDIIRSKTIGKVTSTVATDTYDDGSYTVPCVLYCG